MGTSLLEANIPDKPPPGFPFFGTKFLDEPSSTGDTSTGGSFDKILNPAVIGGAITARDDNFVSRRTSCRGDPRYRGRPLKRAPTYQGRPHLGSPGAGFEILYLTQIVSPHRNMIE